MATGRYKTLLQNTGLMFIGSFGSKIISFIMLPFYTLWLSVEDYGTSDLITVYSTIVLSFVSLCIGEAIFVIPSQKNKDEQAGYFSSSLVFSFVCVIFLVLIYMTVTLLLESLRGSFFNNILYICLVSGSTLYSTIFQQFCKSINRIKIFATAGIVQTLFVATLGFFLIPKYQLDGYIWCILVANVVTALYVFSFARLYTFVSVSLVSIDRLKDLLSYSIPLIPNSVIWLVVSYLNRPLMETTLGLYALGIYSLANRFPTLINTIYNNFSNSWQISILEQYGKEGFNRFYSNVVLISFSIMTLLIVVLTLVTKPLITFFFNSSYHESVNYIPILCLSCLFISLGSMVGAIFAAVRKSKYYFYSSVWSAVAAIVFNTLLINSFGIYGACWACVLSYLIGGFSRVVFAKRFINIDFLYHIILLSLITTTIVCVISYSENYYIGVGFALVLLFCVSHISKRTGLSQRIIKRFKLNE